MNILLIMADQFRADWMSCAGTDYVKTPNIDRIAKRGVRFNNTVCNGPLCAPSRASIAGGVYPHRTGVMTNSENFPVDYPTYYQILRKNGYRTAVIGKTDLHKGDHFYGEKGDLPLMYHLGFTDVIETEGKMNACFRRLQAHNAESRFDNYSRDADIPDDSLAGPYQRYLRNKGRLLDFSRDFNERLFEKPVWHSDVSVLSSEDYHDSFIGKKACEYLENIGSESPWHLFVSFVGPHDPWDAPREYYERYRDKSFPEPIALQADQSKPNWICKKGNSNTKDMNCKNMNNVKRHYAGMISLIDDWVGKIIDVLDKKNVTDNTVIIFCSDHGEMLGDHGLFTKNCMYEGALRVPLIISHPEITNGRIDNGLAELVDLFPTILDIAGLEYDKSRLDGESLLQVITNGGGIQKKYQYSELAHTRMIFDGKHKLIVNYNDINELYDLEKDPMEMYNIAPQNNDLVRELMKQMRKLAK